MSSTKKRERKERASESYYFRNLSDIRFGRQVAISKVGTNKWGNALWLCRCDCGNEHMVVSGKLISGKSSSCGCLRSEVSSQRSQRHGICKGGNPRTLVIWSGMKQRCYTPTSISYKSYGARGISICEEWLKFENFHNWAINNGYQDGLTIDRIDSNGNYCPENCRWLDAETNKQNQRNARTFEISGIRKSINGWCKFLKIDKWQAYSHLHISENDFLNFITNKFLLMKEVV